MKSARSRCKGAAKGFEAGRSEIPTAAVACTRSRSNPIPPLFANFQAFLPSTDPTAFQAGSTSSDDHLSKTH